MKASVLVLAVMTSLLAFTASAAVASREPTEVHVGILMFDGVQIIDFAAPYEVFGHAGFRINTVSADGKTVTTAMGLNVIPDMAFDDAPDFDVLLIPGGNIQEVTQRKDVQTWLRAHTAKADIALSICTGSFILAASGLLENMSATTFHTAFDSLAQTSPGTKVVRDVRWVDNGKIITSAGLSSGIDAALHVVERLLGEERARTVAMTMEYDWDPQQGFVRGLMADRYLPRVPIRWPEDSHLEQVAAYGDRTEWFQRFRVRGKAAPDEYLKAIQATFGGLPNWTAQEVNSRELLLQGKPEKDVDVEVRVLASTPADDGNFELTARVQAKQ